MTHDELLFKIYEIHNNSSDAGQESNKQYKGMIQFMQALRAVIELHRPNHSIRGYRCRFDDETFPCTTIQVIEKKLQ